MFQFLNLIIWSNILFITSMILILSGSILLVIQGGFFNGMIYSFRRFYRAIRLSDQVIHEAEGRREVKSYKRSFPLIKPLIISGGTLFVISLVLSYFSTIFGW